MHMSQGRMYNCIWSSQDAAVNKAVLGERKVPYFPVPEDLSEVCVMHFLPLFLLCRISTLFIS